MNRLEKIHKLRNEGLSFKEIGELLGVSGERVRQLENKNKNPILKRTGYKEFRKCRSCGGDYLIYKRIKAKKEFCSIKCKNYFFKNYNICRICKNKQGTIVGARSTSGRIFYNCNECNNKLAKDYYKNNSNKVREIIRRYETKYPQKRIAWNIAQKIYKKPCVVCGNPNSVRHHKNYRRPMEVIFLCPSHHKKLHMNRINSSSLLLFSDRV